MRTALGEIAKIAALRLDDASTRAVTARPLAGVDYRIAYGKESVPVYRHYATPLAGIPRGARVALHRPRQRDVRQRGDGRGPRRQLPAGLHARRQLGRRRHRLDEELHPEPGGASTRARRWRATSPSSDAGFLERYEQMQEVRVSGRELPFSAAEVPGDEASSRAPSCASASGATTRSPSSATGATAAAAVLLGQRSGRVSMELLKTKGSAFTRFVRDEYTTLPERSDRPLFIRLDVHWDVRATRRDATGADHARYVAGEQVRDVVRRRLPRVRERVDPAARARDGQAAPGALPAAALARLRRPGT